MTNEPVTNEMLAGLGRRLFGTIEIGPGSWHSPFAELLGMTTRQLRRLVKEDAPLPPKRVRQYRRLVALANKPVEASDVGT